MIFVIGISIFFVSIWLSYIKKNKIIKDLKKNRDE